MNFSCRVPSLELAWLPLSERKTLPTPEVRFVDLPGVGGCYAKRGIRDDALELTGARDVLFVSTHYRDYERIPATLAHEFRHMQQHYLPSLPRIGTVIPLDTSIDWEEAIRRFYCSQPWERDALRFEYLHHRQESNEHAMRVLHVR